MTKVSEQVSRQKLLCSDSPCVTHTFMMWMGLGKSAEQWVGTRLVGEVGGLEVHWTGIKWREAGII